jgi:NAD(P)-dependent dehydrogenase (short-subunit alcohol dehydrogenase family)
MNYGVSEKLIVITGANGGLGRQLYEDLKKDNRLILIDNADNATSAENE